MEATAITEPIKEQLFDMEKIPERLLGIDLTQEQRTALSYGQEVYLENMKLEDGSVKDGKVKLVQSRGEVKMSFNFKNEKLEIPDKILDKKLTPKEVSELENGKPIGPINRDGLDFFVVVDKELNKVTVKSEKEIGALREIGDYKLTDEERLKLANGEKLETKVFKGKDGYFLANIQLTEDKRGITFTNLKSIGKDEAIGLIEKYNKPSNITKEAVSVASESIITQDKQTDTLIQNKPDNDLQRALLEAIDKKDYKQINALVEQGNKATESTVNYVQQNQNFTPAEKQVVMTMLSANDVLKEADKEKNKNVQAEKPVVRTPEIKNPAAGKDSGMSL